MDLRAAGRSQRNLDISGWSLGISVWLPLSVKGNLSPAKVGASGDEATKQRTFNCSSTDALPGLYHRLQIDGVQYLLASVQKNTWRGGTYQYTYQLRLADMVADVYSLVSVPKASGLPGTPVPTLQLSTVCSLSYASDLPSSEMEAVDYTRVTVYLPGDILVSPDNHIIVEDNTYDVISVRRLQLLQAAKCLRR